eukprot:GHVQ01005840.1.p1 GENE.GHVQ01005840.1~~GHVQ01005840.1.p1  ORF type:complete len:122 (-),score=48.77 GHVQ01005840.1:591-956(-)
MSSVPVADISEAQKQELLCTYAALILHDEKLEITQDNLSKLITASGNSVEPFMPMLFARALGGKDVGSLLTCSGTPGSGGGGGGGEAAAAGGGGGKEEEKKEEEKEEEEEEEDDMGFSLFD